MSNSCVFYICLYISSFYFFTVHIYGVFYTRPYVEVPGETILRRNPPRHRPDQGWIPALGDDNRPTDTVLYQPPICVLCHWNLRNIRNHLQEHGHTYHCTFLHNSFQ